jgi:hypothetical protein
MQPKVVELIQSLGQSKPVYDTLSAINSNEQVRVMVNIRFEL